MDIERQGEVELIHVARADPRVDFGDAPGVLLFCERQGAIEGLVGGRARVARADGKLGQRGWAAFKESAGLVVEEVGALVNAEPGQRLASGSARRVDWRSGAGLEERSALISEISGCIEACIDGALDFREKAGQFGPVIGYEDTQGRDEEPCWGRWDWA
jgi:hypothetical protein